MYDAYGACTLSRCVSTLIHGWLGPRRHPRLATNFWTRSWFAAADGWTRLPRKVTRWRPGNVRPRTLTDAYRRLPTLIPGAGLLLLLRVTVSIRTPVWLGLKGLRTVLTVIMFVLNEQAPVNVRRVCDIRIIIINMFQYHILLESFPLCP